MPDTGLIPNQAEQRRVQRKEARREALIDAALSVFSKVGFAAAKMDEVATEAQVSKGTVYLYFDSKEDLFKAMVQTKMLPMFDEATSLQAKMAGKAEEQLRRLVKFFYKKILSSERRQIMRLIIAEGPNFPELTAFYHSNILSRGQAVIGSILAHGAKTGEFRALNGHGITQNIIAGAIVAGIWKLVFDPHQPLNLDDYCDTHIDLVLNGLKA